MEEPHVITTKKNTNKISIKGLGQQLDTPVRAGQMFLTYRSSVHSLYTLAVCALSA